MNRLEHHVVQIGDWVAIKQEGKVRMGHVTNINTTHCCVDLLDPCDRHFHQVIESITAPLSALNRLGLGRWYIMQSDLET